MATAEPPAKKARCTPLAPRPTMTALQPAPAVFHPMHPAVPPAAPAPQSTLPKASLLLPAPPTGAPTDVAVTGARAAEAVAAPTAAKKKQFSKTDEETLVALWRDNIEQYYKGVRRRVLERMTAKMNESLAVPPYFSLKQVENKLSYMEKRYKSVLDEMRKLGFSCGADDPSSVRISCERKFCLFYDVHDILGNIVGNDAYTKRGSAAAAAAPNAVAAPAMGGTQLGTVANDGAVSADKANACGVASGAASDADDAPSGAAGGDGGSAQDGETDGDADGDADGDLSMLPSLSGDDSGGAAGNGDAAGGSSGGASGAKRVRAEVGQEPIAARVMKVTERMVKIGERLIVADREERRDRLEMARLNADVRSRELELRLRTAADAARRDKIDALKFLLQHLSEGSDGDARARVLRQLEDVINSR